MNNQKIFVVVIIGIFLLKIKLKYTIQIDAFYTFKVWYSRVDFIFPEMILIWSGLFGPDSSDTNFSLINASFFKKKKKQKYLNNLILFRNKNSYWQYIYFPPFIKLVDYL